ncbi:MAG: cadherin-like beta sandwich domain-containing protein, partial [Chloroflexi bacterium]|nr:cadherin-like beta sandwich domain-containing protein [Chloroflexota bacterium]
MQASPRRPRGPEARPGRARLYLLSVLTLVLLGALALFIARPAQAQNTDATLSGLAAEGGVIVSGTFSAPRSLSLNPLLNSGTTSYTATDSVTGGPTTNTHLKLTPTTRNSGATVEVGKGDSLTAVTSGSASDPIALELGENAITVKVTAADGITTKTYTVTVTRGSDTGKPTNVTLTAG